MVTLKINGETYEAVHEWKDLTIAQVAKVAKISMPNKIREVYDIIFKSTLDAEKKDAKIDEINSTITEKEDIKEFPAFYARVMEHLSNIPMEVILKTDYMSIKEFYYRYIQKFVEGIHYFPVDYEHKDIMSFDFDGETFRLPTTKEIFGVPVPMVDLTALEFVESADLMLEITEMNNQRDVTKLGNILSILCRPEGEEYDEDTCLERAVKFQDLTMDVVWNVFFSFMKPLVISLQLGQMSFLEEEISRLKDQN